MMVTLEERRRYTEGFDELAELITRPERQANAETIQNVAALKLKAKQELLAD